ncbi:hypothetical protein ACP4OV_017790 [Aristida adscensionis]
MAAKAVLLVLVPLLPFVSLALEQDICPADPLAADTPSGYPCKTLAVTADDFFFAGLSRPGVTVAPFNTGLATAFAPQFAGVNGLGLGASRLDIYPGGVVPLHTHPEGSELIVVAEGAITAGFISAATNTVYQATVRSGELFVFPRGLLHFQLNVGNATAVVFAAYSSPNPGLQIVDYALFTSGVPVDVVDKITSLDKQEIERLQKVFAAPA